jgi:outer membrane protein
LHLKYFQNLTLLEKNLMHSIKKSVLLSAVLLAMAGGVQAQKAGDDIISAGIVNVNPNPSLGPLSTTGGFPGVSAGFGVTTSGASASIGSVNTLTIGWLHMFTDNLAAEVNIGIPPKMTVDVTTPRAAAVPHPGAATSTYMAPAVIAKYLFNKPGDQWRPYLGLGLAYVSFSDVTANLADPLVNNLAGTSASLSSSWAPIYNAGTIFNINDRWSISASVSYIPVSTTATFVSSAATGGATTTGTLKLDTIDYVLRVGYKF